MKNLAWSLLLICWSVCGVFAAAKTQMSLVLSHDAARPGETITAALRMVSEPGWHTYWRNPGDAGMPPTLDWQLPEGVTAGAIEWPVPEKMVISKLYAYVYEGETLLLIPLTISTNAPSGPATGSRPGTGKTPTKQRTRWSSPRRCVARRRSRTAATSLAR